MIKPYTPDFPAMMRLCEMNFTRLCPLLPRQESCGAFVSYDVNGVCYRLTVMETTRYTRLIEIRQITQADPYQQLPLMRVRLYYDLNVAEVSSTRQNVHFKARYDYPNKKLCQRDEKHQMNQFLADWLQYCRTQGVIAISVC